MQCPRCQAELESPPQGPERPTGEPRPTRPGKPPERVAATPEEAMRADAPPGPCPRCGWSTMWNE
jgi:hypothetical protein